MFPKMICRFSVTTMKILVENDNPSHNKKKKTNMHRTTKKSQIDKVMSNKNKIAEIIASNFNTL